jgi:hypothetical protein
MALAIRVLQIGKAVAIVIFAIVTYFLRKAEVTCEKE